MDYYFAYGSNMNPERVRKRKMAFQELEPGTLHDYQLVFNKRSVKYPGAASANVAKLRGESTEGVLYRLTHPAQIEMMDPYEGFPIRYSRTLLPVKCTGRTSTVRAWVYIANEDYIVTGLKPARWYLDHLLAGSEFLSEQYVERLMATDCLHDSELEPN